VLDPGGNGNVAGYINEVGGISDASNDPNIAPTRNEIRLKDLSDGEGVQERRSEVIVPAARTSNSGHIAPSHSTGAEAAQLGRNGPHAKLVIHRGRSAGKEFPLNDDEAHIGRWDADGGIFPDVDLDSDDPEAKVSRRHARITRRGGQYFIEDLGSTNGTFINRGRRLLPGDRQPLRDGDEVIVGKTFLRFHVIN
jgi:hypothetical protein